jgi:glycerol-3-phosphate dehydrogenase
MDLTSGAPFWIVRDGLLATYPRLKRDRRCDVAVIGGGITGALVAHRLVRVVFSFVLV